MLRRKREAYKVLQEHTIRRERLGIDESVEFFFLILRINRWQEEQRSLPSSWS
jgi:hypothetical protein